MGLRANRHATTAGDVLSAGLDGHDDLLVVNPPRGAIRDLITELTDRPDPPPTRLLAAEQPLKALLDEFLVASSVADLIAADRIALRTLMEVPRNALLITPESVTALVSGNDGVAGLTSTDEGFVSETCTTYEERWAAAPAFSLRTPPLSDVRETLRADLGETVAADFDRALESIGSGGSGNGAANGDGTGLDEVTISLLVAARNGELLYDISRWGEDVGLASKATFSRMKTRLETEGLVDTEKVPIDVGRPRLRLRLADGLADRPVEELTDEAGAVL